LAKVIPTLQKVVLDYKDRQLIYNFYRYQRAEIRIEEKSATAKIFNLKINWKKTKVVIC